MPQIINVSAVGRSSKEMMPGIINIEAMTTLTGEQKSMMDGIVVETRPLHKVRAPGGDEVQPMMKVKPSPSQTAMGMTKIRGTRY
jgi:hypothetical protein